MTKQFCNEAARSIPHIETTCKHVHVFKRYILVSNPVNRTRIIMGQSLCGQWHCHVYNIFIFY